MVWRLLPRLRCTARVQRILHRARRSTVAPRSPGTRYAAELWYVASTLTDPQLLQAVPNSQTTFRTGGEAGKFNTIFDLPVLGANPGTTVTLQVRVWDTTTGPSYLSSGLRAASLLFNSGQLGGATGSSVFFSADPENWTSFNFSVPEPGTFALVGIGAAVLLMFRRRK